MDLAEKMERQSWNEYFMSLAVKAASRSVCTRRQVGAVAVDVNHRIIGTGYNGPPSCYPHCTTDTCYRTVHKIPSGEQPEKCVAIHAEANLVVQLGERLRGSTVYVTNQPCVGCFKLLIGAGVSEIFWKEPYDDAFSRKLMMELGIYGRHGDYCRWIATKDAEICNRLQ